jgi:hypothetical protein
MLGFSIMTPGSRIAIRPGNPRAGRLGSIVAPPVFIHEWWMIVLWDDDQQAPHCYSAAHLMEI